MTKILGLDLGTASIGWALVERNDTGYALLAQGVDIFQEGVAREKNSEKPAVQDRTAAAPCAVTMPGDDCARSTCSVCSFATTSVLL
ncbi:MAG: hypothetical protein ACLR76_04055 [Alistipes sp.]